jgi:hypothetical protein
MTPPGTPAATPRGARVTPADAPHDARRIGRVTTAKVAA